MNKELEELIEKVKNGTATKEEIMAYLLGVEASLKVAKTIVDTVNEQKA